MERPQHRRFLVAGFVLAGAVLLLLGRHWTSEPDPTPEVANAPLRSAFQPHVEEGRPVGVVPAAQETAEESSAPIPATAAGFRGRIIDAVTRQPVPQFEVQLFRVKREAYTEDPPITRSFKSPTGRFAWKDVEAGDWRATVSAPGYQLFNVDEFQIREGKAMRELVMPLFRGFAVRGRVFELSTGAGIADAQIGFRQGVGIDSHGRLRASAKSSLDGSFTLDGVPGGEIILMVGAQDHAYHELALFVDEKTSPQDIALSAGGTIAGIVTTAAGVPIKATVWLQGPGQASFAGETNDAGQFSYAHMRAGAYRVSAETSAGMARTEFVLRQDEIRDSIALVVGGGRGVRGTIRGLRPEQLQETWVMLQAESGDTSARTRPDASGEYAVNGVAPGRAVVTVYAPDRHLERSVDVPTDQDVTLDVAFAPGARLSGRVTQGGRPAPHKMIWMRADANKPDTLYNAMTSVQGEYEIEGVPSGEYFVRAHEDVSRRVTIAGDTVLNIDIPIAQLSARVVEEGGRVPIVGANVYVRGTATETNRVRGDAQTNDFGQFVLTGIEPGEIVLLVYKSGYELHREKIVYSSPIADKTITLARNAGVDVRVQAGSRRFPRGFTLTQTFPGNDYVVDLWMPRDREGVCHLPSAFAGTSFKIGRFSGEPIVFEDWDGQPFELP